MAKCVQEVLKERSRSLEEAKTMCLELAERERSAYVEWRRCAGAGEVAAAVPIFRVLTA